MTEARQIVRFNGDSDDVSYVPLNQARHYAMKVARLWYAEGHGVKIHRNGMGVTVDVYDFPTDAQSATGVLILSVDVTPRHPRFVED